jgi:hypothetical protein
MYCFKASTDEPVLNEYVDPKQSLGGNCYSPQ